MQGENRQSTVFFVIQFGFFPSAFRRFHRTHNDRHTNSLCHMSTHLTLVAARQGTHGMTAMGGFGVANHGVSPLGFASHTVRYFSSTPFCRTLCVFYVDGFSNVRAHVRATTSGLQQADCSRIRTCSHTLSLCTGHSSTVRSLDRRPHTREAHRVPP